MAKPRIQRWKPDTCGCEIYEYWDENDNVSYVTADEAEQILVAIYQQYPTSTVPPAEWRAKKEQTKICPDHVGLTDGPTLGDSLKGENNRKNIIHRVLLSQDSVKNLGLEEMKLNPDGSEKGIDFKNGVEYAWSFNGTGSGRTLKVSVRGASLTQTQKDKIQAAANTKFGAGKVEIL